MRIFVAVSAIVIAVTSDELARSWYSPEVIEVVEKNKAYNVKLGCIGCPFAAKESESKAVWQASQRNDLLLRLSVNDTAGETGPTVQLNGHVIFPPQTTSPFINALQISPNITWDELRSLNSSPRTQGVEMPLYYKNTLLFTHDQFEFFVVIDVIGLALDKMDDSRYPDLLGKPTRMEHENQQLVQMRIKYKGVPCHLVLDYIEVVDREWRAIPILSISGKPLVEQRISNPSDRDKYGKFGTWDRVQSLITGKAIGHVQSNALVLAMAILLVLGIMVFRSWHQGKRRKHVVEDDALLSTDSKSASGFCTDGLIIKMDK